MLSTRTEVGSGPLPSFFHENDRSHLDAPVLLLLLLLLLRHVGVYLERTNSSGTR